MTLDVTTSAPVQTTETESWILNSEQMTFMLQHHNPVLTAYQTGDLDYLRVLAASPDYQRLFGEMSFDEAYDRYESMLAE